jgi:hypothetical protein
MTGPVALAVALNAALGLRLVDASEARDWLTAGGFEQLDTWIETHRADPEEDMTDVPDLPEWITT